MGNCATCCGNAGTNEIVTEKQYNKLKGAHSDNNYPSQSEYPSAGYPAAKRGKIVIFCFTAFCLTYWLMNSFLDGGYEEGGDPFISGDLEINNEIYNNPAVMVSTQFALNMCRKF